MQLDAFKTNGSSPPAGVSEKPNAAIVRRFITEYPAIYDAMMKMAKRRLGSGPRHFWRKTHYGWKELLNITREDRATTAVHDAVICGMTSATPYKGNPNGMTSWFMVILHNRIKDQGRHELLERLAHEAMVAARIAQERMISPGLARTPPALSTTHDDETGREIEVIRPVVDAPRGDGPLIEAPHAWDAFPSQDEALETSQRLSAAALRAEAAKQASIAPEWWLAYLQVTEDGKPLREVAKELGVGKSTVERRIARIQALTSTWDRMKDSTVPAIGKDIEALATDLGG
jgi:DNA-directed RNA polymerase specialized sigma24 family protein